VIVVGHQNALRALVKVLEPEIEIEKFDLPTATPLVFEFGEKTHRRFFEVSQEELEWRQAQVAMKRKRNHEPI
jgi:bisphosphoglycerate-dependent phosphoglycerate mutase